MPSCAKFLKEILSNKKKHEDNENVMLTAECNATIQNNMPPKLKDPDSLMPLSTCKKLNLGELRPTKMSLQLADRSVKFQ